MNWRHRTYSVAHSRDGWLLQVDDEPWAMTIAERAVGAVLGALGHPCCGKGPLKGPLTDSDAGQLFWFQIMNLPNKLYRWNRHVAEIPLTEEQAETLAPEWVAEYRSRDENEEY